MRFRWWVSFPVPSVPAISYPYSFCEDLWVWLSACRAWAGGCATRGRSTNEDEKGAESQMHPIGWSRVVEVKLAVDVSRPQACLIRITRLNERVCVARNLHGYCRQH